MCELAVIFKVAVCYCFNKCVSVSALFQLDMSESESNTVVYFGLFEGHDPNPSKDPGYIIMSSFLIFYKWFHSLEFDKLNIDMNEFMCD